MSGNVASTSANVLIPQDLKKESKFSWIRLPMCRLSAVGSNPQYADVMACLLKLLIKHNSYSPVH